MAFFAILLNYMKSCFPNKSLKKDLAMAESRIKDLEFELSSMKDLLETREAGYASAAEESERRARLEYGSSVTLLNVSINDLLSRIGASEEARRSLEGANRDLSGLIAEYEPELRRLWDLEKGLKAIVNRYGEPTGVAYYVNAALGYEDEIRVLKEELENLGTRLEEKVNNCVFDLAPYKGKRILVVGSGNSKCKIAKALSPYTKKVDFIEGDESSVSRIRTIYDYALLIIKGTETHSISHKIRSISNSTRIIPAYGTNVVVVLSALSGSYSDSR